MNIKPLTEITLSERSEIKLKRGRYGNNCIIEDNDMIVFKSSLQASLVSEGVDVLAESLLPILINHNKMVKMLGDIERQYKSASDNIKLAGIQFELISTTIKNRTHKAGE